MVAVRAFVAFVFKSSLCLRQGETTTVEALV